MEIRVPIANSLNMKNFKHIKPRNVLDRRQSVRSSIEKRTSSSSNITISDVMYKRKIDEDLVKGHVRGCAPSLNLDSMCLLISNVAEYQLAVRKIVVKSEYYQAKGVQL